MPCESQIKEDGLDGLWNGWFAYERHAFGGVVAISRN